MLNYLIRNSYIYNSRVFFKSFIVYSYYYYL